MEKEKTLKEEKGLIHIYCGDGKGKTTCGIGLCIRAAGSGMKVLIVRFLKRNDSGELKSLEKIPEITILPIEHEYGFYNRMDEKTKEEARKEYNRLFEKAVKMVSTEEYGLLLMDELMAAYRHKLIDREKVVEFLKNKPEKLEIIMTGRNPEPELLELADYISEIHKIKHPFDQGIPARKGIEL